MVQGIDPVTNKFLPVHLEKKIVQNQFCSYVL